MIKGRHNAQRNQGNKSVRNQEASNAELRGPALLGRNNFDHGPISCTQGSKIVLEEAQSNKVASGPVDEHPKKQLSAISGTDLLAVSCPNPPECPLDQMPT